MKKKIEMPVVFWLMTIEDERLRYSAIKAHEDQKWVEDWNNGETWYSFRSLSRALHGGFTWSDTAYSDDFRNLYNDLIKQGL